MPTQHQGNPILVFHLGGCQIQLVATRIEAWEQGLKIIGNRAGKFLNERYLLIIGLNEKNSEELKNNRLTIPIFWRDSSGGTFLSEHHPMNESKQNPKTTGVFFARSIVAITPHRVESIGFSLKQLKSFWDHPHGTPILDPSEGYICLHLQRKEAL